MPRHDKRKFGTTTNTLEQLVAAFSEKTVAQIESTRKKIKALSEQEEEQTARLDCLYESLLNGSSDEETNTADVLSPDILSLQAKIHEFAERIEQISDTWNNPSISSEQRAQDEADLLVILELRNALYDQLALSSNKLMQKDEDDAIIDEAEASLEAIREKIDDLQQTLQAQKCTGVLNARIENHGINPCAYHPRN